MRSVACAFCGGTLEVTPESLRRHVLVCVHCDAIQRLKDDGTVAVGDVPKPRPTPPEVRIVERRGEVRIEVPRLRSSTSINKPDLIFGAILTSPVALALLLNGYDALLALLAWGGFGLVAAYLRAYSRKRLPPTVVRGGRIWSSSGYYRPFSVSEIRQIYSTRTTLQLPDPKVPLYETFNVWALLDDGRRVHVAGPVDAPETALWLEEWLENRLGIAQLPVEGEGVGGASTPAPADPAAEPRTSSCDTCGADLPIGADEEKKGWVRCEFCEGLTLLYPPDSAHPILGLGRPAAPRRYEITRPPAETTVRPIGLPPGLLGRVVVATTLVPLCGGLVVALLIAAFSVMEGELGLTLVFETLALMPLVLGLAAWYVLAWVLRKPTIRIGPRCAEEVVRPLPVPYWRGLRRLPRDGIEQIRVRAYSGRSRRGLASRATEQVARSSHLRSDEFGRRILEPETTQLARVEIVPVEGPPMVIADAIEHPTEAFEIERAIRRALRLAPAEPDHEGVFARAPSRP